MELGITKTIRVKVTEELLARNVGSGDLEVFATPSMIACMEKASLELVAPYLNEGESTVGTKVDVSHIQASLISEEIKVTSELILVDRRRLVFNVKAYCKNVLIGEGSHERFIINSEKFMAKLKG